MTIRQDIWAITAYFNPAGYKLRLKNYHLFRQYLSVPLLAVELSFDGHFELGEGDADILVPLAGSDVMWQKERLLNVALEHLPRACDNVAWLDCDCVFDEPDWPMAACRMLEAYPLIHLFRNWNTLAPGCLPSDQPGRVETTKASVVRGYRTGALKPSPLRLVEDRRTDFAWGAGWAARRELLDDHGFYDVCILGGGDVAMACAAFGDVGFAMTRLGLNARQENHYLAWAKPFFASVRGNVGQLNGVVNHLWHGSINDRRYRERALRLGAYGFDPLSDIERADNGCWRWTTHDDDSTALHEYIKTYFASRNEDG